MATTFTASDAASYDRLMGRWSRLLAAPFLDFAGLEAADRVLDVGCGTGSLTRLTAAHATRGAVEGIDFTPAYIEHANAAGTPRTTYLTGDATSLPYADGAFDRVFSLLVLSFVPDWKRAIAEMLRVTRPGGTGAAAMWDFEGGMIMHRMIYDTAAAIDPGAHIHRQRAFGHPLTKAGELAAAFTAAGWRGVEERPLTIWMQFASFEDFWTPLLGRTGGPGSYVATLTPDKVERLCEALRAAYCAGRDDGPRRFAAIAHAVRGLR
jgi:SAM-dependent methyltransferase